MLKVFARFVAAGLTVLCLQAAAVEGREGPRRPNVIVMLADDLGFSDVSAYGGSAPTPQLDSLASKGLRFSQFYNSARCWPSRASIMTGLYPHAAGHAMQWGPDSPPAYRGTRRETALMLPEVLKANGYRTYHVGKWHLGTDEATRPLARGFDRSYWLPEQDNHFNPKVVYDDGEPIERPGAKAPYYSTDALGTRAAAYITAHARDAAGPFFMYLAFTAPHFPLQAPQETIEKYRRLFAHGWDVERRRRYMRLGMRGIVSCRLPGRDPEATEWRKLSDEAKAGQVTRMAIHAAMNEHIDRAVGTIRVALEKTGQLEDTLILFLSDNGASAEQLVRGDGHDPAAPAGSDKTYMTLQVGWSNAANSPFREHKIWLHEGGIATPLIAHWPRGIRRPGRIVDQPSHIIDIVPTVLAVAGIEGFVVDGRTQALPGRSLAPLLKGSSHSAARTLFWEHEGNRALRRGSWKLVSNFGQRWELYDMVRDRCETRDLARVHPKLARRLEGNWQSMAAEMGVVNWEALPQSKYTPSADYRRK